MEIIGNTTGEIILYQSEKENNLNILKEKIALEKDVLIEKENTIIAKEIKLHGNMLSLPRYIRGVKMTSVSGLFIKEYSNIKELDIPYGIEKISGNALKDNKINILYLPITYVESRNNSMGNVDTIVFKGLQTSYLISKEDIEYYYYRNVRKLIFECQEVNLR